MRKVVFIALLIILSQISNAQDYTAPVDIGGIKICPNGFRLDAGVCNRFGVPDNAIPIGSDWYCVPGYKKDGNRCVKLDIPENAIPTFGGWVCKVGYKQSQSLCVQKSWAELNSTAEFLMDSSIHTRSACEKLCDLNYYGEKKEECNRFCKGELKSFTR